MLGMSYTRLGNALQFNHEIREAHQYATKALHLGEEIGSQEIIGYSLAVLCYTFRELGLLEEAISHGEKVRDSMHLFHTDSYLSRFLLAG
ncbi:MAG: hypothetical protein ACXWMK_11150, partial [Syntrophales bacterium]